MANPLLDGAHVVHFYESDQGLMSTVGDHLSAAALAGDALVLVATREHRRHFAATMMRAGVDVPAAVNDGRIIMLDAAETIDTISRDGRVDAATFEAVIGSTLRAAAAAAGGRAVHAYGEMVVLLWENGDVNGAIRLEELWNDLAQHESFSLFCAYPQHLFLDLAAAERFADVCHTHSSVLGGAEEPAGAEVSRHFPATVFAPRLARRFVTDTPQSWGLVDALAETRLVTSELATNAALYGRSEFIVALSHHDGIVRVMVSDPDSSPLDRPVTSSSFGGRGLAMVDALSREWHHEITTLGKCVWAEIGYGA